MSRPQKAIDPAFQLVRLARADLPGVVEVEKLSYDQPWTVDNFIGEFDRRITLPLGFKIGGQVAAHCFFWLLPPEIHLLNVAVRPEFRRLGLARRLLEAMIHIGKNSGANSVFLEARAGNDAAIKLYRSLGFTAAGARPGYYEDGEDAILMNLEII